MNLSDAFYDLNCLWDKARTEKFQNLLIPDADAAAVRPCTCILDYPGFPTDDRDYYSLARYYHPNPQTQDGLPYVARDGVLNPESLRGPKTAMGQLAADVLVMGIAGLVIDAAYAGRAVERLRKWFLDPLGGMNPNLNHAQAKPGINDGSACGTIDSHAWVNIILGLELLAQVISDSKFFKEMRDWFGRYADWLYTSDHGRAARNIGNNISTWWAAQIMVYAGYSGHRQDIIGECVQLYRTFLGTKMDDRGCFFGELRRTRSLHYNLFFLTSMGLIATCAGPDLWQYRTSGGHSIAQAFDFVAPFLTGRSPWPYPQIETENMSPLILFDVAARYLHRPEIASINLHLNSPASWHHIGGPDWLWMPENA